MAENRYMPRYKRRMRVRYSVSGMAESISYTIDVGPGGICVMANKPPARGASIAMYIERSDGSGGHLRLEGQVAWSKQVPRALHRVEKSCFGVRLVNAPEDWYQQFLALAA